MEERPLGIGEETAGGRGADILTSGFCSTVCFPFMLMMILAFILISLQSPARHRAAMAGGGWVGER